MVKYTGKYPMVKCPECNRDFSESYIQNHRRQKHGIYGGRTGLRRSVIQVDTVKLDKRGRELKPCEVCGRPMGTNNMSRHMKAHYPDKVRETLPAVIEVKTSQNGTFKLMTGFVLLEASDGSMWLAEKIK